MSHSATAAGHMASRFFKVLASSALALSAVTGGLAITAQESKASPWQIIMDTMTGGMKEVQTKDMAGFPGAPESFDDTWSPYVGDKRVKIIAYDFISPAPAENTFTFLISNKAPQI